ncbi:MAG TPA: hypothetical protein VEX13_01090 [Chloroflexia bacterium]|nr:hypothetical protein [Chloroflexia bacterium]
MMKSVVEELLTSLDILMETHNLDELEPEAPVCVDRLLQEADAFIWYYWLPEPVLGISTTLKGDGGITLNRELMEVERSADYRYASAHEFGHLFRQHCGQYIVYSTEGRQIEATWRRKTNRKMDEREADIVAAYILVRRKAVEKMKKEEMEADYVAALLDVPKYLVELRWHLYVKYGR